MHEYDLLHHGSVSGVGKDKVIPPVTLSNVELR